MQTKNVALLFDVFYDEKYFNVFRPNPRHRRHQETEEEELAAEHIQSQRIATLNHATSSSRSQETSRGANGRRRYSEEEAHVSQTVVLQQQQRPARHTKPLQPPTASPQQPPKLPQKKRHMPQVIEEPLTGQTCTIHRDCLKSGCSKTGLVRNPDANLPIGCVRNVQNLNSKLQH